MAARLAVINPGTQYTQQAVKRLRERGFGSDVFDVSPVKDGDSWSFPKVDAQELRDYPGYIILGSRHSVYGKVVPKVPDVFQFQKPVLGVCYGAQFIADFFGGEVRNGRRQYGPAKTQVDLGCPVFSGLEEAVQQVCMSHGDHVDELPNGFQVAAESKHLLDGTKFNDAFYHPHRHIIGVQFHPEVFLTTNGSQMLENFARLCGLEPRFESETQGIDYGLALEERLGYVQKTVPKNARIIAPLSGGVDSSVAFALTLKAGVSRERIHAFHIDTGLNRLDESREVIRVYNEVLGWDVELIDASETILNWKGKGNVPLRLVVDDALKRRLFQEAYNHVLEQILKEKGFDVERDYVLQGTLETDKVESGRGKDSSGAAEIKRHHNVGGPLDAFKHLEPNAVFFKDQVRALAKLLELPESIATRQPFPGPGNSIRIVGYEPEYNTEAPDLGQVQQMASKVSDMYGFDVYVAPLRFVGTMGDERAVGNVAIIQHYDDADWEALLELSTQLPWYSVGDKGSCVTRVLYALDKFDPATVQSFTATHVDREELQILQQAEHEFSKRMQGNKAISQNVVYLTASNFGMPGKRSIVLRPFHTPDFMTGRPVHPGKEMPLETLSAVKEAILKDQAVAAVLFDLTYKPNGTTEPH
jgi:GMP synthase (glutamine-hydrolysing)